VLFEEVAGVGSMYARASRPQKTLEVCVDVEGLDVSQRGSGKHSEYSKIGLILLLGVCIWLVKCADIFLQRLNLRILTYMILLFVFDH
jgi:hypothetical protein